MGKTSTGMHEERVDARPGPRCFEWFGRILHSGGIGKVRLTVIARRRGWSIVVFTRNTRGLPYLSVPFSVVGQTRLRGPGAAGLMDGPSIYMYAWYSL